jgi:hypothetical protein
LLQRALAGTGAAVALAGCGGGHRLPRHLSPAVRSSDVEILSEALALERRTIDAYVASIPLLPSDQVYDAKTFLGEELQHAGELITLIKSAGGRAPDRADSYAIGHPRGSAEVLALLHSFERLQIASYLRWIPRLTPGPYRAAVATILASDAQHVAVLRAAQGMPALASAFVTGDE